jgi:hypothetical protein
MLKQDEPTDELTYGAELSLHEWNRLRKIIKEGEDELTRLKGELEGARAGLFKAQEHEARANEAFTNEARAASDLREELATSNAAISRLRAEREELKRERDKAQSDGVAMRSALIRHQEWHLSQKERRPVDFGDEIGQVDADEYQDSELFEITEKALAPNPGQPLLDRHAEVLRLAEGLCKRLKAVRDLLNPLGRPMVTPEIDKDIAAYESAKLQFSCKSYANVLQMEFRNLRAYLRKDVQSEGKSERINAL